MDSPDDIARAAFAHGWALTAGPWTPRVTAAARVAIAYVREHGTSAEVLEAVVDLGSLEGVLADVVQRRNELIAGHVATVMAAWRKLTGKVSARDLARSFRKALGVTEAADEEQQRRRAAAQSEAEQALHGVVYPSDPAYQAAVSALADALLDAQAEGHAAAAALVAEKRGTAAVDFNIEFRDAHTALEGLDTWAGEATSWFGRILDGQAADVGTALARVARDGGNFDDMVNAVSEVLDGEDIRAVQTITDLAMSQSFSRGAATLYTREGLTQVDYSTAGGARVCPICLDAESGNPWSITEAPKPALHPACRCVLLPVISSSALFGGGG